MLQKEHAEDLHRQRLLVESLVEVAGKVKEAKDKKVSDCVQFVSRYCVSDV